VVIRYLHIVGVAIPPHEAHAELVIDGNTVLASPVMLQFFHSVAARNPQISSLAAELSMASFFLDAFLRFAGGILWLLPVSQNSFVLLSANVLMTNRV